MQRVVIVGVGPGTLDYLTPAASRAIAGADVLVGGKRHLRALARNNQETFALKNNLPAAAEFIRSRMDRKMVVLASGDPGMFGILSFLRRHFPVEELKVIPGISSVQLAFARLALPWHDAVLLSVHGREPEALVENIRLNPKVAVLTGPLFPPEKVARLLVAGGIEDRLIYCCSDLTYPDEQVIAFRPEELCRRSQGINPNCVMVIVDEKKLEL